MEPFRHRHNLRGFAGLNDRVQSILVGEFDRIVLNNCASNCTNITGGIIPSCVGIDAELFYFFNELADIGRFQCCFADALKSPKCVIHADNVDEVNYANPANILTVKNEYLTRETVCDTLPLRASGIGSLEYEGTT